MSGIKAADTHESEEAPAKGGSLWILVSLICLLLAYPLSIGPVANFYDKRSAPPAVIMFYAPLRHAYERSKAVHKALDSYARLWGTTL